MSPFTDPHPEEFTFTGQAVPLDEDAPVVSDTTVEAVSDTWADEAVSAAWEVEVSVAEVEVASAQT